MGLYKGNLNQHMSSASHKEEEKKKDVAAHVGGGTNHFLVPHLAALPPVHAAARDRCLELHPHSRQHLRRRPGQGSNPHQLMLQHAGLTA